ncbi:DUF4430 domain-containing protein [Lachnospiraceae bacterium]|nr:DUF4430 domain-containing protein [uncultured Schaedlerella sp.]NBI58393.1 DUF4430 domain-containing protein [Lachnospiraceae bacterium]
MRKKCMRKQWSFFLCIVLIVAMALSAAGCNGGKENQSKGGSAAEQQTESDAENGNLDEPKGEDPDGAKNENPDEADSEAADDDQADTEGNVLGEGETQFPFTVVDQEGEETLFEIHTDKETVGEALQDVGLIEGEEGEYGLFVKTVNGITADYDKDGVYWAFYVNGEYAAEGVDSTKITEGDTYAFKVE